MVLTLRGERMLINVKYWESSLSPREPNVQGSITSFHASTAVDLCLKYEELGCLVVLFFFKDESICVQSNGVTL